MIKTVNWKELKSVAALVCITAMGITCLALGIDSTLLILVFSALAGIGGYEFAKSRQVSE